MTVLSVHCKTIETGPAFTGGYIFLIIERKRIYSKVSPIIRLFTCIKNRTFKWLKGYVLAHSTRISRVYVVLSKVLISKFMWSF